MDRAAQKAGTTYSGVEGIAMQDASLQESMGPIVDRTKENLVSTDNGIIMARHRLMRAAKALVEKGTIPPGVDPAHQQGALGVDRAAARPGVQGRRQGGADGIGGPASRTTTVRVVRSAPMLSESARMTTRRRGAVRIDYPNSKPRAVKVIALDRAERGRGQAAGAGLVAAGDLLHRLGVRGRARERRRLLDEGWLRDLAGRTKDLIDEVDTADLVVMVATAGENARAPPR